MTDELTPEMAEAAQNALIAVAEGRCPTCGASGTKEQVGQCVYMSCGHRYQGTLKKGIEDATNNKGFTQNRKDDDPA